MARAIFLNDPTNAGKPDVEIGKPKRFWSRALLDDVFGHRFRPGQSGWLSLGA